MKLPHLQLLFILGLLLFSLPMSARHITGRVKDVKTHKDVVGATVELLTLADSSFIRGTVVKKDNSWGHEIYWYKLDVDNNTDYLLRISAVGYKTQYKKVKVRMAQRVAEQFIDDVELEPDSKLLSEVVVKATKIKMVNKGDTLVFDATAFNLSEGSMLDALIRQLPGSSIKDGVISVNGRKVSSLLINGRDFFKGDAKKALENLPAYTVDKVKAYDKAGVRSRLVGKDMGDKEYVLDVNLKKQYHRGAINNVDLAAGTHNRYSAQMFTMSYTDKDRLSIAGRMNNVSNSGVPGQEDVIANMVNGGNGKQASKNLNLDYRHEGATEDDFLSVTGSMSHSDTDIETRSSSQTFLSTGDHYGLSNGHSWGKPTSYSGSIQFSQRPKKRVILASAEMGFTKGENLRDSRSGTFSDNPQGSLEILDSLFAPVTSERLRSIAIHRVKNLRNSYSQQLNGNFSLSETLLLGSDEDGWKNMLNFGASGNHSHSKSKSFSLNNIDYFDGITPGDHRNQFNDTPNSSSNIAGYLVYSRRLSSQKAVNNMFFLSLGYHINYTYSSNDNALYRLDQLADYSPDNYPIGLLPSARSALDSVLDVSNSYNSRNHTTVQSVEPSIWYTHGDGTRMPHWGISFNLPVKFKTERQRYFREKYYSKNRNSTLFEPTLWLNYHFNDSTGTRYARFGYSSNVSLPDLITLMGIHDDSNPLAVTDGNPNLRNQRTHQFSFIANVFSMERQRHFGFDFDYNLIQDAIASRTYYETSTGITHTQQVNVGGNWSVAGGIGYGSTLDKKQRLMFDVSLRSNFNNSVDLMQTSAEGNERSDVRTLNSTLNFRLNYSLDERLSLELAANANNQYTTSNQSGFEKINAWDNNVVLNGTCQLPWDLEFSTEVGDRKRSGYNDEQMNTNDVVWNLRLTKRLLKGRLMFAFDAFDILGQLNNTSYSINEQGRTETWTNSIPRYCMLHVAFKFLQPSKKS
ncbi:MAG: outer membrane beta-barrel protein [Prevotella sp.]